jgi:peptidoglycan/xylan/chitin deacetylase (PgdA/CDA1 family)
MHRLIAVVLLYLLAQSGAFAAECKPDALGTSRVIAVDPAEHGRIGTMQYAETLPLKDHEVVLTFDDGPLPPNTGKVLDILASECVKATFFLVGQMATEFPATARRTLMEGHTIATHSETHAPRIWTWPADKQEADFSAGIASAGKALGDPQSVAPFFRFPGLGKSAELEAFFAAQGIMIWSADFPADDWLRVSSRQVAARAIDRLERKGRGVLLLHDIHRVTVAALPVILAELKKRHYSVVQVVAAGPDRPKTATEPAEWVLPAPPPKPAVARVQPPAKRTVTRLQTLRPAITPR